MRIKPPKIDKRSFTDIEDTIHGLVPHYTREWEASDEKDPGVALIKIFSHITENIIHRLNQVPQKNFVAFLDMLGIKRLQAQSARVPVTFMLARGSDTGILIPERTRVSAEKTEEHDELPFETEANLMATPGQLATVFGIDPFKDAIYAPQKKFLDIKNENRNTIVYKIASLSSKDSRDFQLDHVTGIEKGDVLKISDNETGIEYVTVSEITANIVKIEEHMRFDHPENTKVEKIMDFNLFEGKNWQEHILYIGDKDIFNIKGTAKFDLFITHRAGTEKAVTRIENAVWQYWGEVKEENASQGKKEDGDDWHDFNVVDGTNGFTSNGEIQLSKLKNGEIKEKEIKLKEGEENGKNSIKSRWIRCKLRDSLGIDAIRVLPVLDNITLTAESVGENLLPDLVFNNDKPLDLEKFLPFGKEPRIYDNFAIGSKEIFSKKGAEIEIKLTLLDPEGLMGAVSAILSNDGKILAFARGSYGGLLEANIDLVGEKETHWTNHGYPRYPYFTKIEPGSTPCSVLNTISNVASIFVKNVHGHIYERYYCEPNWCWRYIGIPAGVPTKNDIAAVFNETSGISIFVTGTDGCIYEYNLSSDNTGWKWISHSKPVDAKIDSSLHAHNCGARVKIFAKGSNGNLYELDCEPNKVNGDWTNHGTPNSAKVVSRPFGVVYKSNSDDKYYAKIFIIGSNGKLYKFISETREWIDLKKPPGELKIVSDPQGYLSNANILDDDSDGKHIFVRCDDNQLWELLFDFDPENNTIKKNIWKSHGSPQDSQLYYSPVVIYQSGANNVCVISASNQNSIIERKKFNGEWKEWETFKDPVDKSINPILSWEYWNKTGWVLLKVEDNTSNFQKDGNIRFKLPDTIEETEVSGQKNYWIRVRIVSGSYGNETFILESEKLVSDKSSIRPPRIERLAIEYHLDIKTDPQYCITYNNLEYINQTEASRIKDKFFKPFVQLDDKNLSIYMGFDRILKSGPLRIFFAAKELNITEANRPKMEWVYSIENGWSELKGCSDNTEGLIRTDLLEFKGPADFSKKPGFGKYLSWLKGILIKGKYEEYPLLTGIYPNSTWAYNEETIKDEFLGSSSGLPDQVFSLLRLPVLENEEIRVCEILNEKEKQDINEEIRNDTIKPIFEVKDETGNVTENWVLWKNVPDFFDSTEKDRHYILDRVTGKIRFGNGKNGMIPQIGDNNIRAFSYQTGRGVQGNIRSREIKSIKSSVPGIDSVLNPAPADGGADAAALDQVLEFGPAMISNRNRAVTAEDFEWLAKKASRKVAKVKCLPNRNNLINQDKEHIGETGWITVVIVPDEKSLKPMPSLELRRKVQKYLGEHCSNILNSMQHIWVDGPVYIEISVHADIYVKSINSVSFVEREAGEKLDEFFHPLKGGPGSKGWDFGQDVNISDIYAILGNLIEVDHIEKLRLDYSEPAGKDHLFYWDDLPGSDNERLIDYLVKNFYLDWVKTATIMNSDDLDISLFGWEEFFRKDNRKLIEFLTQNFNAEWVRSASISKDKEQEKIIITDEKNCLSLRLIRDRTSLRVIINDNIIEDFIIVKENGGLNIKVRTIKISEGDNALFLRLDKDETAVNLMINGGRINEFIVRNEKGRLKIYNNDVVEIRPNFLVAGGKHVFNVQFRKED